ncbi:3-deoxy-D-manno-octulosonic acid transferase, partial [Pseudomonas syringae]
GLRRVQHDARLIRGPRPPGRCDSVHAACQQQGFATVRRAAAQAVTSDVSVLRGDTMGELLFLYALADIAFVGGSLVPNGGHNLLGPAALAKPVLSGPHLFNFLEIASMLPKSGALQEVNDAAALATTVQGLFDHPQQTRNMADAGLSVVTNYKVA